MAEAAKKDRPSFDDLGDILNALSGDGPLPAAPPLPALKPPARTRPGASQKLGAQRRPAANVRAGLDTCVDTLSAAAAATDWGETCSVLDAATALPGWTRDPELSFLRKGLDGLRIYADEADADGFDSLVRALGLYLGDPSTESRADRVQRTYVDAVAHAKEAADWDEAAGFLEWAMSVPCPADNSQLLAQRSAMRQMLDRAKKMDQEGFDAVALTLATPAAPARRGSETNAPPRLRPRVVGSTTTPVTRTFCDTGPQSKAID